MRGIETNKQRAERLKEELIIDKIEDDFSELKDKIIFYFKHKALKLYKCIVNFKITDYKLHFEKNIEVFKDKELHKVGTRDKNGDFTYKYMEPKEYSEWQKGSMKDGN